MEILILRSYGTWVARNPIFVLSSSLAVVAFLGFGLVRFTVETRPEKVCTKFLLLPIYRLNFANYFPPGPVNIMTLTSHL